MRQKLGQLRQFLRINGFASLGIILILSFVRIPRSGNFLLVNKQIIVFLIGEGITKVPNVKGDISDGVFVIIVLGCNSKHYNQDQRSNV